MLLASVQVSSAFADISVSPDDKACSDVTGKPFCSLNAAVRHARLNTVIRLASHRYVENVAIDKSVRIVGAARDNVVIDGGETGSVFYVNPAVNVTLENLTIINGYSENGGGVHNQGRLTIRNCTISKNVAQHSGGGIYSGGSMSAELLIEHASITNNESLGHDKYKIKYGGGGIYSNAPLRVADAEISNNRAVDNGGGIYSIFTRRRQASLVEQLTEKMGVATPPPKQIMLSHMDNALPTVLRNVRIVTNRAGNGGGLHLSGRTDIRNSHIYGNAAVESPISSGGGIFAHFSAQLSLVNVNVLGNSAALRGGGIWFYSVNASQFYNTSIIGNVIGEGGKGAGLFVQSGSAQLELSHSILDQNLAGDGHIDDCAGSIVSAGYNFYRTGDRCKAEAHPGDIDASIEQGVDSGVELFADDSGYRFKAKSPLIDAGNPSGCKDPDGVQPDVDAQGNPRLIDGNSDGNPRCDIGAIEMQQAQTSARKMPENDQISRKNLTRKPFAPYLLTMKQPHLP
jgi:predicted outer membrane repeat protein